jgi:hypothetical protein
MRFISRPGQTAALAVLIVLAVRPLGRGLLIDGHDARNYPPRLVEMARVLGDGALPPVWAPDLGGGHGQPLFEFAPPLAYVAALPFFALGCGLANALQFGLALLVAAGAVAAMVLGRRSGGGPATALGVAAAWLFAPYLTLDLYVRAAFAEASALAVAPLALLLLLRAVDRPGAARVVVASAALALVMLAHIGAALLLLPACGAVALVSALAGIDRPARVLAAGASMLGGLGLSAYFWLPALLERSLIKTDLIVQGLLWSDHSLWMWQLFWSPWQYGTSRAGPGDTMSFAIGPLHLALAAAGVLLVLREGARTLAPRRLAETIAFALVALAGAWLATLWSAPLWSRLDVLQYLGFPWRALMLPALFLPLLAAPALEWLGTRSRVAAIVALVAVNLGHTEPKGYVRLSEANHRPESLARYGVITTSFEEYEPATVGVRPPYTDRALSAVTGAIELVETDVRAHRQELRVTALQPTQVETRTFFYPGWTLVIDDQETPVAVVPDRGTMTFIVPAGTHRVVLELRPTAIRRAGAWISVISLIVAVATLALHRRRKPPRFGL